MIISEVCPAQCMTQMGLFDDVMLYYPSDRIGACYINLGAQHSGKLHLKKVYCAHINVSFHGCLP